jgi:hypothetical protein
MTVLENLNIASPTRGKKGNAELENAHALLGFVGYKGDLHARAADLRTWTGAWWKSRAHIATRPAVLCWTNRRRAWRAPTRKRWRR